MVILGYVVSICSTQFCSVIACFEWEQKKSGYKSRCWLGFNVKICTCWWESVGSWTTAFWYCYSSFLSQKQATVLTSGGLSHQLWKRSDNGKRSSFICFLTQSIIRNLGYYTTCQNVFDFHNSCNLETTVSRVNTCSDGFNCCLAVMNDDSRSFWSASADAEKAWVKWVSIIVPSGKQKCILNGTCTKPKGNNAEWQCSNNIYISVASGLEVVCPSL